MGLMLTKKVTTPLIQGKNNPMNWRALPWQLPMQVTRKLPMSLTWKLPCKLTWELLGVHAMDNLPMPRGPWHWHASHVPIHGGNALVGPWAGWVHQPWHWHTKGGPIQ